MTVIRRVLLAPVVLLAACGPAAAHSLLLESSPAAGATLTAGPPRLVLRFNNRLEHRLSRVRLVDEHGGSRPLILTVADTGVDRLTAAVPPLAPGTYRVDWRVLSTDGHIVDGSFSFRVVP